jgi:hypothetical protein
MPDEIAKFKKRVHHICWDMALNGRKVNLHECLQVVTCPLLESSSFQETLKACK